MEITEIALKIAGILLLIGGVLILIPWIGAKTDKCRDMTECNPADELEFMAMQDKAKQKEQEDQNGDK